MFPRLSVLAAAAALLVAGLSTPAHASAAAAAVASPRVSLGPDVVVGEGSGSVTVPVTLSAAGLSEVRVNYNTFNNTATTAADYTCPLAGCATGTLVFAPGQTSKSIRVPITNDAVKEPLESFTVNLIGAVSGGTVARSQVRVSIADNDAVVASPALFVRDAVVDESVGVVNVPVIMGGSVGAASAGVVTVHYATADGTAVAGSDYTAVSGTLTFAPGQTVQNVAVRITNDTAVESAEALRVVLSAATGGSIGGAGGTVTIGASDAGAVASPRVSVGADVVVGEGAGFLDVPVTLSAPGTGVVTVNLSTFNNTATTAADYTCPVTGCSPLVVSFEPGQTTRTVRIDLLDDAVKEPLESFTVNLIGAVSGGTVARAVCTITIKDDD